MERIVVLGGGFAGATLVHNLQEAAKFDVTLVDAKDYFEVNYAALRGVVDEDWKEGFEFLHSSYLNTAHLIVGKAKRIDKAGSKVILEDGQEVPFDKLIIGTGRNYNSFIRPSEQNLEERITHLHQEHEHLAEAKSILIVGGGPVGVELAGELLAKYPEKKITLVHAHDHLLMAATEKAQRLAAEHLTSHGVNLVLGERVASFEPNPETGAYVTDKGTELKADIIIKALGNATPNTAFMEDDYINCLNKKTEIMVNRALQVTNADNLYAIGDVTDLPGTKLGVAATMQADLLAKNLISGHHKEWSPLPDHMMFVTLGPGAGVMSTPIFSGASWLVKQLKSKHLMVPKVRKKMGLKEEQA